MKKTLLFLLTIFTISAATAQGNNLEFNQTLNKTFNLGTAGTIITNAFIIPSGKIWKITYGSVTCWNNNGSSVSSATLYFSNAGSNLFGDIPVNGNIVWLPAGSYDLKFGTVWNGSPHVGHIHGIEFNIVQ